ADSNDRAGNALHPVPARAGVRAVRLASRYLLNNLGAAYMVAAVAIGSLLWLLQMLDILEQGLGGAGDLLLAALSALSRLPEGLIDLLPVITVLATAAAMGVLQTRNELTILRVAGLSIWRLTALALIPGVLVSLLALSALQWVIPEIRQQPESLLGATLGESGLWHPAHGLWIRSGDEYLNVETLRLGRIPTGIDIYQFDDEGHLQRQLRADQALVEADGNWVLEAVKVRDFTADRGDYFVQADTMNWASFLSARQLELLLSPPASLPLSDLWQYVQGLKERGQDVAEFEMVLWKRLVLPLTCLVMVLAAMATAAVPLKSRAVTVRLVGALVLGLGFHMLTELATFVGLLMNWPVIAVAVVPPLILALLAVGLIARAR
ncbi:MAG: LPS export ABC transporter permease LptG, partial [Pseudomonadota bacterium]